MIEYFDHIYIICLPDRLNKFKRLRTSLQHFYPDVEPQYFEATDTRHLNNHFIGNSLSHRNVIQHAKSHKYKRIMVFEEDAILHKYFNYYLDNVISEMQTVEWDMVKLGGHNWEFIFHNVENCKYLQIDNQSTCIQGLCINESIFDIILKLIPDSEEEVKNNGIVADQLYLNQFGRKMCKLKEKINHFITHPRICTQDPLVGLPEVKKPDNIHDYYIPK